MLQRGDVVISESSLNLVILDEDIGGGWWVGYNTKISNVMTIVDSRKCHRAKLNKWHLEKIVAPTEGWFGRIVRLFGMSSGSSRDEYYQRASEIVALVHKRYSNE